MGRENTGLTNYSYDNYLSSKAKTSRTARQELEKRTKERRNAHGSDMRGYHFGIDDRPVKVEGREHFEHELSKRGLMLRDNVTKELRK